MLPLLIVSMLPVLAAAEASQAATTVAAPQAKRALTAVAATSKDVEGRLRPQSYSFPGGSLSGYDPGEVAKAQEELKKELLSQLSDDSLAGLRAYVEAKFPEPDLEVVALRGQSLATRESTGRSFGKVSGFLDRLQKIDHLSLNLKLLVVPGEALVELWPANLPSRKQSYAAGASFSLVRGIYAVRVQKPGYKKSEFADYNLVDNDGSVLECKLYPLNAPDGPYPCVLK